MIGLNKYSALHDGFFYLMEWLLSLFSIYPIRSSNVSIQLTTSNPRLLPPFVSALPCMRQRKVKINNIKKITMKFIAAVQWKFPKLFTFIFPRACDESPFAHNCYWCSTFVWSGEQTFCAEEFVSI